MSEYLNNIVDYINITTAHQDVCHQINTYLKEVLPTGVEKAVIQQHIQHTWGPEWSHFTDDLIWDIQRHSHTAIDYTDFIQSDQNTYYEIRDYLREALPRGDDEEEIGMYIQVTWGDTWSYFTEDLIGDVSELQEYEQANGLPTKP